MGIKGDDIGNTHSLQLLKSHGAIQAFPVTAAVLPAAVKKRHNDTNPVGLSAGSLDQTLQIHEMIVRAHGILPVKQGILATVIADIHHKIEILAAHSFFNYSLPSPEENLGHPSLSMMKVSFFLRPVFRPGNKMVVDFFSQLPGSFRNNQPQGRLYGEPE